MSVEYGGKERISRMKEEKRKVYYLFSPFLRMFHWIMVLCIIPLFITGLLITKPVTVMGIEPTYTSCLLYTSPSPRD